MSINQIATFSIKGYLQLPANSQPPKEFLYLPGLLILKLQTFGNRTRHGLLI
jgi:hypothetical protein